MNWRDFGVLVAICAVWAVNNITSKIIVGPLDIPPLAYAAARFAVVGLCMLPWLLPAPKPLWKVLLLAQLIGGANFALMFIGLQTATPSAVAVVLQVGVPMTILISMIFLREQVGWRRALGIALTLSGALLVMWDPHGFQLSAGLLFVAAACLTYSIGAVMLKTMEIKPMQLQAWVGFASFWPLLILSAWLEPNAIPAIQAHWLAFAAAVLFSALIVSVVCHTLFYGLIQRYDASLLQPITLITPLLTIALGVAFLHDPFDARLAIGSAIALAGVLIIVIRLGHLAPLLALRSRT